MDDQAQGTKDCTVTLTRIEGAQVDNLPKPSVEETRQMRCTGRKCTVTDYNNLINYDENDEIASKFQSSPNKRKKRPTNLLRKPSRTRQKIERN